MNTNDSEDFGFDEVTFSGPIIDVSNLRKWWHQILRHQGRYHGYLFFLALPTDKEAIEYLKDFGHELHLISGKNLLVIILTDIAIMRHHYDQGLMRVAVDNQIMQGYSLQLANLFGIKMSEFPCILFFENSRSSEHVLFSLKHLTTMEIASNVRNMIDIVNTALEKKKPLMMSLKQYIKELGQRKIYGKIIGSIRDLPAKTLEVVIETWLKTMIH